MRQVVPPLPFGEESILLDVDIPAHVDPPSSRPWVVLEKWHILRQPTPRLLVCDEGAGLSAALELAPPLVEALDAVATVLGIAPDARGQDALRETLARRAGEAGLIEAAIRVRRGDAAEQIANETREAPYDFVVAGAGELASMRGRRSSPSFAEELAAQTTIPLLLARGRPRRIQRILICTAVGEPGKTDVRAGGWLARRLGAAVTLLHVTHPDRTPLPFARAHLERGIATLRELGVRSRFSVRQDETPLGGILAELRAEPYDLLVVGAGGTITRQALREAGCSILVVPEGSW